MPYNRAYLSNPDFVRRIASTLTPHQIDPADYCAIYYAGGHGTMWDLPENARLAFIAATIYEQGGVVGAVCHGPAGLVNIRLKDESYLVAGKEVSSFSNDEEEAVGLTKIVPFLLESKLIERGARHSKTANFQPHTVVSERLVTGQNPASATGVGQEMARLLEKCALQ